MTRETILITGCSAGGTGFSLAKEFQKRGLTVFATARDVSKMSELGKLPNVVLLPLDVTSPSSVASAVEEVKSRTGGELNYLFNNAGLSLHAPTLELDIDEAKKIFDVNFWGVFSMVQAFAPLLIKARGTIINMGSLAGMLHLPFGGTLSLLFK